jgi:hypothetical protein
MMRLRAAWLVVVLGFLAGSAEATPITYNVADSIGSVSITGTLTTDGNIGLLTAADFLGFSLTVSNGTLSDLFTPANAFVSPLNTFGVIATPTTLGFGTTGKLVLFTPPPGDGGLFVWALGPDRSAHTISDPLSNFFAQTPDEGGFANATFASAEPTDTPVPEPATLSLLGLGGLGLGVYSRRRRS